MRANESALTYNKTWAFLQFRYYDMNFSTMRGIISDIQNYNHSPLPFNDVDDDDCQFTYNKYSTSVKGCILLQIQLNDEQYKKLKESNPNDEIK